MHDADCSTTTQLPDDYAARTVAYFLPAPGHVLVEQRVLDRHYQPLARDALTYRTRVPCDTRADVERIVRPLHTAWIAVLEGWLAAGIGEDALVSVDRQSASLQRHGRVVPASFWCRSGTDPPTIGRAGLSPARRHQARRSGGPTFL